MVLLLDNFFFRYLAFFEVPGLCAATPDQELQLPESETYLISMLGVCKNILEKESDQSGNSTDGFAPAQIFCRHLVFFEVPWSRAATPDQELQLPESQTYLIRILGVCKNALEKESDQSGNYIDGFAPAQIFCI